MVKRFKKHYPYTLCLITLKEGDIHTWCVNVMYKNKIGNVTEFVGDNWIYTVDLETKIVTRTDIDGFVDDDYINLTNIVCGWTW